MQLQNVRWMNADQTIIGCDAEHPELGFIPMAVTADYDTDFGLAVFQAAVAGSVSPYVAPPLTLADFQAAHDAHLNAAAKTRKYDSIHTAALRAAYPGPWHAEGVAFATWMDACNVAGYTVLAEVEAATRTVPTIAEYLAELPVLVLP